MIETKIVSTDEKQERLKEIKIVKDADLGFGFHEDDGTISFMKALTRPCVIKTKKHLFRKTTYKLKEEKIDNIDINLFHEMCHWFHALQDRERKRSESNERVVENELIIKESSLNVLEFSIGKFYYGNIERFDAYDERMPNFTATENYEACVLFGGPVSTISFEEMRTIYGIPPSSEGYHEGDDLCENLYRKSLKTYLRLGHKNKGIHIMKGYAPSVTVIKRVLYTIKENYRAYKN